MIFTKKFIFYFISTFIIFISIQIAYAQPAENEIIENTLETVEKSATEGISEINRAVSNASKSVATSSENATQPANNITFQTFQQIENIASDMGNATKSAIAGARDQIEETVSGAKSSVANTLESTENITQIPDNNNLVNYTSERHGIQFKYPSDWSLIEKTSRFESGPDIQLYNLRASTNINLIVLDEPSMASGDLQQLTNLGLELVTGDYSKEYKTIEYPSIFTTNGIKGGTFLITEQDKYEDYATKYAKQFWIIPKNDKLYSFAFVSPTSNFDNPENIDIRDSFIKSIKFLNAEPTTSTTNSTSRFD